MQNWDGSILARKAMDCSCKKTLLKEDFLLNMLERYCCCPLFPMFVSLYITCYYVSAMIVDYMIWLMSSFDSILNDFFQVLDITSYEARQKYYASKGQKHFYFMALNGGEVCLLVFIFVHKLFLIFLRFTVLLHITCPPFFTASSSVWKLYSVKNYPITSFYSLPSSSSVYYVDFVSYSLFLIHPWPIMMLTQLNTLHWTFNHFSVSILPGNRCLH